MSVPSFSRWHQAIKEKDGEWIGNILADDILFSSPAVFKSYKGKPPAMMILSNVLEVIQSFQYQRTWLEGRKWGIERKYIYFWSFAASFLIIFSFIVLEFRGKITDSRDGKVKDIHGVDIIEFNKEGKIANFAVMVRPFQALEVLKHEMGIRIVAQMKQIKSKL